MTDEVVFWVPDEVGRIAENRRLAGEGYVLHTAILSDGTVENWATRGDERIDQPPYGSFVPVHDPRNPEAERVVRHETNPETHPGLDLRKTLVLLQFDHRDHGPVFFVIEGLSTWPTENLIESERYFYEESQCPTNFIPVTLIATPGDTDPHGLFDVVDVVWMTDQYDGSENYLCAVFPQLNGISSSMREMPE